MKKSLLIFVLLLASALSAWAQAYENTTDFSAGMPGNRTIYYNITSDTVPYTVAVDCGCTHFGIFTYDNYPLGDYVIPETVTHQGRTYTVTAIGFGAFSGSSVTSVTIPNTVTVIDQYAFNECASLRSIVIPNSVTTIGNNAFSFCPNLISVTIPSSVTSIGKYAFYYCTHLASDIHLPSVTYIGQDAFNQCDSVTSITLGDSLSTIGTGAFYHCSSLDSITIPNSVTSLGYDAFSTCDNLTSVIIGNSLTRINSSVKNS